MCDDMEIVEMKSTAVQIQPHLPPLDTVNATLRFSNGAVGSLSFSAASSKVFEFNFVGTRESVAVEINGEGGNVQKERMLEPKRGV